MKKKAKCIDCGIEYGKLGLDLVLPDQQWKIICPENGILCANCICKRAAKNKSSTAILACIDNLDYGEKKNKEGDIISNSVLDFHTWRYYKNIIEPQIKP